MLKVVFYKSYFGRVGDLPGGHVRCEASLRMT